MSRKMVTVIIVVFVGGMLLMGYQILSFRLGLPSLLGFLFSRWIDISSGVGGLEPETKGWLTVIVVGFVVLVLLARMPKLRKY
jgi:hypothetical protein